MKKNVTQFCLIASLLIILDSFEMWRILMEFFFVGIIPGTDYKLAPWLMLMLMSVTIGLVIGSVVILPYLRKYYLISTKKSSLKSRQLGQA